MQTISNTYAHMNKIVQSTFGICKLCNLTCSVQKIVSFRLTLGRCEHLALLMENKHLWRHIICSEND